MAVDDALESEEMLSMLYSMAIMRRVHSYRDLRFCDVWGRTLKLEIVMCQIVL